MGNLEARRDLTDVRDIVRAYRLLAESGVAGEVYNVCSGRDVAIAEVADAVAGAGRRELVSSSSPTAELMRPVDVPVVRGDPPSCTRPRAGGPSSTSTPPCRDVLDQWRERVA